MMINLNHFVLTLLSKSKAKALVFKLLLFVCCFASFSLSGQSTNKVTLQPNPLFQSTDIPTDDIKGVLDPNMDDDILIEMFQMGRVMHIDGEFPDAILDNPQILADFAKENDTNMLLFKEYLTTGTPTRREDIEAQFLELY